MNATFSVLQQDIQRSPPHTHVKDKRRGKGGGGFAKVQVKANHLPESFSKILAKFQYTPASCDSGGVDDDVASPSAKKKKKGATTTKEDTQEKRKPAWYTEHAGQYKRLGDEVSRSLEEAYAAGKCELAMRRSNEPTSSSDSQPLALTQSGMNLFRDEQDIDFYGRKAYLTKYSCNDNNALNETKDGKALRKLKIKAPPHKHLYSEEFIGMRPRVAVRFPTDIICNSVRNITAFSCGARHITTGTVPPPLEDSLPVTELLENNDSSLPKIDSCDGSSLSQQQPASTDLFASNFAGVRLLMAKISKAGFPPISITQLEEGDVSLSEVHSDNVSSPNGQSISAQQVKSQNLTKDGWLSNTTRDEQVEGHHKPLPDIDMNCSICKLYYGRTIAASNGGKNPYLGKTEEWKKLLYNTRVNATQCLQEALQKREATKTFTMRSPDFLASIGRKAQLAARRWETTRLTQLPKKVQKQSHSPSSKVPSPIPTGQRPTRLESLTIPSIWNDPSNKLCSKRRSKVQCILLYARLLYYLELIHAPISQEQQDIIMTFRQLLITDHCVSRHLFFNTLNYLGPKCINSRGNMRILHYIRLELGISTNSLIQFVKENKNNGWNLPRDLAVLNDRQTQ